MKSGLFWAGTESAYGEAATTWWPFPLLGWEVSQPANIGGRGKFVSVTASFPLLWTPKLPNLLSMALGVEGERRPSYTLWREYSNRIEAVLGAVPISYAISGTSWSGEYVTITVEFLAMSHAFSSTGVTFGSPGSDQSFEYYAHGRDVSFVLFEGSSGGIYRGAFDFNLTVTDIYPIIGPIDWNGYPGFIDSRTTDLTFDGTFAKNDYIIIDLDSFGALGLNFIFRLHVALFYLGVGSQFTVPPFYVKTNDLQNHAIASGESVIVRNTGSGGTATGVYQWGGYALNITNPLTGYYSFYVVDRNATTIMGYGSSDNWVWYKNAIMISVDKIRLTGTTVDGEMGPDKIQLSGSMEPGAKVSTVY